MASLPITPHLPEIQRAVSEHLITILQAAPGAGKSTEVPLALLDRRPGKILLLEPRRVAARSLAHFLARRLGEPVGRRVGYRMRGETKVSSETKLEIITEGLLTRMLLEDPSLEGVSTIIFDEFHERSLHGDTALALAVQSQRYLREFSLLIMSATLEAARLQKLFPEAPFLQVPGVVHPVETFYRGNPERLEKGIHVAIREAVRKNEGDILVFLPGRFEIGKVLQSEPFPTEVEPLSLTADTPTQESERLFQEHSKRRVILSTSVAETSVTLPGVRVVIDSGLSRYSLFNADTGMDELVTRRASAAQVEQRRGRAGRTAPGICYRLWEEGEQLRPQAEPEILRGDLSTFALELLLFGVSSPQELPLLDLPSEKRWSESLELLRNLNAVDERLSPTAHGKELVRFGVHPRIAHLLLRAREAGVPRTGAYLAALLEGGEPHTDLVSEALVKMNAKHLVHHAESLLRTLGGERPQEVFPSHIASLLAASYPERLAKRTERGTYQLAVGGEAKLLERTALHRESFLAVARISQGGGRIVLAEPIARDELLESYPTRSVREVFLSDGRIRAETRIMVGALIVDSRVDVPTLSERIELLTKYIEDASEELLFRDCREQRSLIERYRWGQRAGLFSDELRKSDLSLLVADYVTPTSNSVEELPMGNLIEAWIGHEIVARMKRELPDELLLPTGTKLKLEYRENGDIAAQVILQELFGATRTPTVAGRALLLELLNPARRVVQTTKDLESFWKTTYPVLRGQLQREYPKHSWPEDPKNAAPVLRGLKRNEGRKG